MRYPDTLPPAALERSTGSRWGSVRRWRPIAPDPAELVEVHRDLRGGGYAALSRIVSSPIAQAYVATRADEIVVDGLGRILAEIEIEEGDDA